MNITAFPMCCGARVIQNFSGDSEAERNRFVELVQNADKSPSDGGRPNRLMLVILNDQQAKPKTLQTLADLGFVFVARQNNGLHDSWINLFVRQRMEERTKYVEPPFTYPGTSFLVGDELRHIPDLAKVVTPKPVVPNPFIPPSQRPLEYGFVRADKAA